MLPNAQHPKDHLQEQFVLSELRKVSKRRNQISFYQEPMTEFLAHNDLAAFFKNSITPILNMYYEDIEDAPQ